LSSEAYCSIIAALIFGTSAAGVVRRRKEQPLRDQVPSAPQRIGDTSAIAETDYSKLSCAVRTPLQPLRGSDEIFGHLLPVHLGERGAALLVVPRVAAHRSSLNPYIEDVARRVGTENFSGIAPDGLTSVGGYPGDDEKGGAAFAKVDRQKMAEDFVAAAPMVERGVRTAQESLE